MLAVEFIGQTFLHFKGVALSMLDCVCHQHFLLGKEELGGMENSISYTIRAVCVPAITKGITRKASTLWSDCQCSLCRTDCFTDLQQKHTGDEQP